MDHAGKCIWGRARTDWLQLCTAEGKIQGHKDSLTIKSCETKKKRKILLAFKMLLVLHLNWMTSIQPLGPLKEKDGSWRGWWERKREGWWGGAGWVRSTGAVISKNTCFSDCFTKAVCTESGGARMRASLLTSAGAQLSFNPLREDLSKLKLGDRSLKFLPLIFFYLTLQHFRMQLWTHKLLKIKII